MNIGLPLAQFEIRPKSCQKITATFSGRHFFQSLADNRVTVIVKFSEILGGHPILHNIVFELIVEIRNGPVGFNRKLFFFVMFVNIVNFVIVG